MNEQTAARITTTHGVDRDARGRPGRRQVTVMSRTAWAAACSDLGAEQLPWTTRRANLLVDGVELRAKIGYELRIGDAVLVINGETRPCRVMEEAHPGLLEALRPEWRGGVMCRVKRSGDVAVGSAVVLVRNPVTQTARLARHHGRNLKRRGRAALASFVRAARKRGYRGLRSRLPGGSAQNSAG